MPSSDIGETAAAPISGSAAAPISGSAAARYTGARVNRVEDARLLTGTRHVRRRHRPPRDAARLLRAQPVRPGPARRHRRVARRSRHARRARGLHRRRPQPRGARGVVLGHRASRSRTRRGRRWPRARSASSATRWRSSSPRDRYVAEDAAELVVVDYDPLPPVVDYAAAARRDALVHEGYPDNVAGSLAGAMPDALSTRCSRRRHTSSRRRSHQQAYAAVPMETRGIVVEWSASEELTIWAATQSPHEVRVVLRPAARVCPSTGCGSSCATRAAGSARRSCPSARTCAWCSPR